MPMPEHLMSARDGTTPLGTAAKTTELCSVHRDHRISDCGASLDRIGFRSNAWQARFVRTFCNRLSD